LSVTPGWTPVLVASGNPQALGFETQPRAADRGVVDEVDDGVEVLVPDVELVELGVVVDDRLVVDDVDELDVLVLEGLVVEVEDVLVAAEVVEVVVEVDVAVPFGR
jgi:hypothetical protein